MQEVINKAVSIDQKLSNLLLNLFCNFRYPQSKLFPFIWVVIDHHKIQFYTLERKCSPTQSQSHLPTGLKFLTTLINEIHTLENSEDVAHSTGGLDSFGVEPTRNDLKIIVFDFKGLVSHGREGTLTHSKLLKFYLLWQQII